MSEVVLTSNVEAAAQIATVFHVGDRVQSDVHGGIGIVANIVVYRPTGEPLLIVSNGMCRWPVLAAEATLVPDAARALPPSRLRNSSATPRRR